MIALRRCAGCGRVMGLRRVAKMKGPAITHGTCHSCLGDITAGMNSGTLDRLHARHQGLQVKWGLCAVAGLVLALYLGVMLACFVLAVVAG